MTNDAGGRKRGDRPKYEPPRAIRLGDARTASGGFPVCEPGSGPPSACGGGASATDCNPSGNAATPTACISGTSAIAPCFVTGSDASAECAAGTSAVGTCSTGSSGLL